MNTHANRFASYVITVLLLVPMASLHAAEVANLRCEYRENPLGLAQPKVAKAPVGDKVWWYKEELGIRLRLTR